MKVRTEMSPAMRVMAAVVLLCWSTALAICWHHCATGACSGSVKTATESQPSCHSHADDSDTDDSKPNEMGGSCFAKKPFSGGKEASSVATPSVHLAYLSVAFQSVPLEIPDCSGSVPFRQSRARDWVFTPEVCLGPAFRSLAPPVLS
jgi:hypothetical protein